MNPINMALVGFLAMFALILLRVPIAFAMAGVGVAGFAFMTGSWPAAFGYLSSEVMNKLSNPDMAVIPMFVLMGNLATVAGLSSDIYRFANSAIGHIRGGLAMATIVGCGIFGAVCGSAAATTATFVRVAQPEMAARDYGPRLVTGTIAAGGGLGMLVPPSVNMVIYAVMAEQFIVDLFMAAFIPAVLCIALFCLTIAAVVRLRPGEGPAGRRESRAEVIRSAGRSRSVLLLIILVLGGIYGGIFTVNEAAAVGCFFTFVTAVARGSLNRANLFVVLKDTILSACMVYMILIGAGVFGYFITATQMPLALVRAVTSLDLTPLAFFTLLMLVFIILGAVFEALAVMLLTLPLLMPLVTDLGYSLIWWGVVNMAVINVAGISPPIGMNIFVVQGLARAPLATIYAGVLPFALAAVVFLFLVCYFPELSLFFPGLLQRM